MPDSETTNDDWTTQLRALDEHTARASTADHRAIDPREWLVMVSADGFLCGGCREVLVAPGPQGGSIPTTVSMLESATIEHLATCRRAADILRSETPFCTGENTCDGCGWCRDCERFVGEPHIPVCACPPDKQHLLCPSCRSKRTAWALTDGAGANPKTKWWDDILAEHKRRLEAAPGHTHV